MHSYQVTVASTPNCTVLQQEMLDNAHSWACGRFLWLKYCITTQGVPTLCTHTPGPAAHNQWNNQYNLPRHLSSATWQQPRGSFACCAVQLIMITPTEKGRGEQGILHRAPKLLRGPMRLLFSPLWAQLHAVYLSRCLDSMSERLGRIISNAFTVSVDKLSDAYKRIESTFDLAYTNN